MSNLPCSLNSLWLLNIYPCTNTYRQHKLNTSFYHGVQLLCNVTTTVVYYILHHTVQNILFNNIFSPLNNIFHIQKSALWTGLQVSTWNCPGLSLFQTSEVCMPKPNMTMRSSMDTLKLDQPSFNLNKFGYRAISVAWPRIWNELPRGIRHSRSVTSFKQALKTHLYRRELFPLPS